MIVRRRLHLQIYLTILASLLAVVVVIGAIFAALRSHDQFDFDEKVFGLAGRLVWMALPPARAPRADQVAAVQRLGGEFNVDISLFDREKRRIATYGRKAPPPGRHKNKFGWQRQGKGPNWQIKLPDGRWLSINVRREGKPPRPLLGIVIMFVGVAAAIGLASYPFVRRLTGRIERLQVGVEKIRAGDLTARVRVEGKDEIASLASSFNTTAEKIERLINSNRQLLANASHELRTPLTRVRLGVEMLKDGKAQERQAALEQDIAELDGLIDEILIMSRLDTGEAPHMVESVDMLALVAEEASRYDDCKVDGDVCEVQGNSKLLRRLVRNLIDNAYKHGEAPVVASVRRADGIMALTISDQGQGIPIALQEKVFEPFFRAPGKQNVSGYGLGLALVKQIAEAHEGTIKITSIVGGGGEITVSLPLLS